jgi:hypothetical protein
MCKIEMRDTYKRRHVFSCQIGLGDLNRNRSIEFGNDNKERCRSSSGTSRDEHAASQEEMVY